MMLNILKAVIGIAIETPIAIVADAITLGGALTENDEPYTATALRKAFARISDATDREDRR